MTGLISRWLQKDPKRHKTKKKTQMPQQRHKTEKKTQMPQFFPED